MTRSLHWTQTPANLDDYSADCIQPKGMGPFQLAPSGGDQGKTPEGDVKKTWWGCAVGVLAQSSQDAAVTCPRIHLLLQAC